MNNQSELNCMLHQKECSLLPLLKQTQSRSVTEELELWHRSLAKGEADGDDISGYGN